MVIQKCIKFMPKGEESYVCIQHKKKKKIKEKWEEKILLYSACFISNGTKKVFFSKDTEAKLVIALKNKRVSAIYINEKGMDWEKIVEKESVIDGCFFACWMCSHNGGLNTLNGLWISPGDEKNEVVSIEATLLEENGSMKDMLNTYHTVFVEGLPNDIRQCMDNNVENGMFNLLITDKNDN